MFRQVRPTTQLNPLVTNTTAGWEKVSQKVPIDAENPSEIGMLIISLPFRLLNQTHGS